MIHLIDYENKVYYENILQQMFENRRQVFIDKLDWNLNVTNGREIDEFDTDDTIYLVVVDEDTGKIRSSLRLNPTSKPHLMSEVFPHLCEKGVPVGDDIWEISRYCYNPDFTRRSDRLKALNEIMCGVMETSLLYGWKTLTFVIGTPLLPHCIGCGWSIMPIGLPVTENRQSICAFKVDVTQEGLRAVRSNASLTKPSLRILPGHHIAA